MSFLAIRLAEGFIHPTVFKRNPEISGSIFATFLVSWAAVTFLAYVLYRVELAGKRLDADSAGAPRGAAVTQSQYVAAAYSVVFVFVLVYVAIIAAKLARLQRETAELVELARAKSSVDA